MMESRVSYNLENLKLSVNLKMGLENLEISGNLQITCENQGKYPLDELTSQNYEHLR